MTALLRETYSPRIRNDGSSDTDILNATGSSYTLVDPDEGKTIKVRVSFTDDAGNDSGVASPLTLVEFPGWQFQGVAPRWASRSPLRVRKRKAGFGFPDSCGLRLDANVGLLAGAVTVASYQGQHRC